MVAEVATAVVVVEVAEAAVAVVEEEEGGGGDTKDAVDVRFVVAVARTTDSERRREEVTCTSQPSPSTIFCTDSVLSRSPCSEDKTALRRVPA